MRMENRQNIIGGVPLEMPDAEIILEIPSVQHEISSRIRSVLTEKGHILIENSDDPVDDVGEGASKRIWESFSVSTAAGLVHLAGKELSTHLAPAFDWWREFGRLYLTKLCHIPELEYHPEFHLPPPDAPELEQFCGHAPPMDGIEFVRPELLASIWLSIDEFVRDEIKTFKGTSQEYLMKINPAWRLVGRVTFHLAENKRDPTRPFAFLATYTGKISKSAKPQYLPLGKALQEYAGIQNRQTLLNLLSPINFATEKSAFAKELVESKSVFQPQAWSPKQAYRFLKDIPLFEAAGLLVRLPDWWKSGRPSRPAVQVRIGEKPKSRLDAETLLDFHFEAVLDGEPLTPEEIKAILDSGENLVQLKGKWVEVDREKLNEALDHWRKVQKHSEDGISFLEGMRLLAGAPIGDREQKTTPDQAHEWSKVLAGDWLSKVLDELRNPQKISLADDRAAGLKADLRPYQKTGVEWLNFMNRLGLGACLADDMGLGKTVQVLALLLRLKTAKSARTSLLIIPASLIGNWKAEIEKFAPSLTSYIIHPSENKELEKNQFLRKAAETNLVITSYGMLARLPWISELEWEIIILDEAQAIKNPGTKQTRSVKQLKGKHRIVLTGTPVENRLSDLWSLFDFINPGLLGTAKQFGEYAKQLSSKAGANFGPMRSLVRPYIIRRLKTDKNVISDLPEKTEMQAFCSLTKAQAALYSRVVRELAEKIQNEEGIARRGAILAAIMKFKQICNHPSHFIGDGIWSPSDSGKFARLAEICESIASRREKPLVFSQFKEITEPLLHYLSGIFKRNGLVLHGETPVKERPKIVEQFQQDDGPPFLILTVKAGGTGLNLTAASHVIHFDRWWNPAVENQATDRAFRIGQKKNVLVHKFVCKGTIEEKIDTMINDKKALAENLLGGGGEEKLLTEMSNDELIKFVSLDLTRAINE